MKIINRIEIILDLLAMSQQQLADKMGSHRSQLNRIVRGATIPRLDTAYRIARALGFPLQKVFLIKSKEGDNAEVQGEEAGEVENTDREESEFEDEKNEGQALQID